MANLNVSNNKLRWMKSPWALMIIHHNIFFREIMDLFSLSDVNCGRLPKINFGRVSYPDDRTTHNATAVYLCDENYSLVGDEVRVCSDDGKWNGTEPRCECKLYPLVILSWLHFISIHLAFQKHTIDDFLMKQLYWW